MRIISSFFIIFLLSNCAAALESPFQIRTGITPSSPDGVPVILASYKDRCEELSRKRIWYWPWIFPINSREAPADSAKAYRFKTVMTKSDMAISVPGFLVGLATQTDIVEKCDTNLALQNLDAAERQTALAERNIEKAEPPTDAPVLRVAAISDGSEFSEIKLSPPSDANVILFGMNDATVSPEELQKLRRILEKVRNQGAIKLIIVGHADSTGERSSNVMLSWNRAIAVAVALEGLGQARDRLMLLAAGPDWQESSLQNQRRVEIILVRSNR